MLRFCDSSPYSYMLSLFGLGKTKWLRLSWSPRINKPNRPGLAAFDLRVLPLELTRGRRCTVASAKQITCHSTFESRELCLVNTVGLQPDQQPTKTHKTLLFHHPIFHPNTPRPHHVRHHNISEQPIADYSDLVRPCHSRFWRITEVIQYLCLATRLLS